MSSHYLVVFSCGLSTCFTRIWMNERSNDTADRHYTSEFSVTRDEGQILTRPHASKRTKWCSTAIKGNVVSGTQSSSHLRPKLSHAKCIFPHIVHSLLYFSRLFNFSGLIDLCFYCVHGVMTSAASGDCSRDFPETWRDQHDSGTVHS